MWFTYLQIYRNPQVNDTPQATGFKYNILMLYRVEAKLSCYFVSAFNSSLTRQTPQLTTDAVLHFAQQKCNHSITTRADFQQGDSLYNPSPLDARKFY